MNHQIYNLIICYRKLAISSLTHQCSQCVQSSLNFRHQTYLSVKQSVINNKDKREILFPNSNTIRTSNEYRTNNIRTYSQSEALSHDLVMFTGSKLYAIARLMNRVARCGYSWYSQPFDILCWSHTLQGMTTEKNARIAWHQLVTSTTMLCVCFFSILFFCFLPYIYTFGRRSTFRVQRWRNECVFKLNSFSSNFSFIYPLDPI